MNVVDYKFIMIPLLFVLLRMWSLLLGILVEYARLDLEFHEVVWKIFEYLAVSLKTPSG